MVFATDIELLYPSSDGKPMAENKVHYRWITTIEGNLESLFAEDPMVFVAADMNWHPVPRSHPPKEMEKERERDRADLLAAKLRELGLDPDKI